MLLKLTDKKLKKSILINPSVIDDVSANRDGEGSYVTKAGGKFYLVEESVEEITELLGRAVVSLEQNYNREEFNE